MYSFEKKLNERIEKGSVRSLLSFENRIDFWSNDYLGLAQTSDTIAVKGSTGSRLISGNSSLVESVEHQVATHFGSESALIFNSGYDANLGILSSIPQKGDTVLYDEYVHASVRDGIRLSFAQSFSFKHNDLVDLERQLAKAKGAVFVAVESLYSMDGDIAPLVEMLTQCKKYQALLIVDEAHSGGVFGPDGTGLCAELGIEKEVFIRLFTFGKAFGAHGAAVCCSEPTRQFLINFARSFIYTTALPEAFYSHIFNQILRSKENELRIRLLRNVTLFRELIGESLSARNSPIQMIDFPNLETCLAKAEDLQNAGFAVKAILPPTIPEGKQRIRVCIHGFNTEEEIQLLSNLLV